MDILIIAPKHLRIRMASSDVFLRHIIGRKIGADIFFLPKSMRYNDPNPIISISELYNCPKDRLIYFTPDIPPNCTWKEHIKGAGRVVGVAQYYEDIVEMQPMFDYALQENIHVELYSINKEDYHEHQKEIYKGHL